MGVKMKMNLKLPRPHLRWPKLSKPRLGWVLLITSVTINVALLTWLPWNKKQEHHESTKEQALLFALDRCTARLERYVEIKALADSYDKMVEGKWNDALNTPP